MSEAVAEVELEAALEEDESPSRPVDPDHSHIWAEIDAWRRGPRRKQTHVIRNIKDKRAPQVTRADGSVLYIL